MVEEYEESIEAWYKNHKEKILLTTFLCEQRILKKDDKCNLNYF
jgi:hypothetical protein